MMSWNRRWWASISFKWMGTERRFHKTFIEIRHRLNYTGRRSRDRREVLCLTVRKKENCDV